MRLRQCYAYSVRIASRGSNVTRIVCETHMRFLRGHFGVSLGPLAPLASIWLIFIDFRGALGTRFSTGLSTMTQKSAKFSPGNCYFRVWGTLEWFGVILRWFGDHLGMTLGRFRGFACIWGQFWEVLERNVHGIKKQIKVRLKKWNAASKRYLETQNHVRQFGIALSVPPLLRFKLDLNWI